MYEFMKRPKRKPSSTGGKRASSEEICTARAQSQVFSRFSSASGMPCTSTVSRERYQMVSKRLRKSVYLENNNLNLIHLFLNKGVFFICGYVRASIEATVFQNVCQH